MTNDLEKVWGRYDVSFGKVSDLLPQELRGQCHRLTYAPGDTIIQGGDCIRFIHLIESGIADGMKQFENGKDYQYFKLDKTNGAIGLFELFSHRQLAVATVVAKTAVDVLRIDAAQFYIHIVENQSILLRCAFYIAKELYDAAGKDGHLFYQNGLERVCYYLSSYCAANACRQDVVIVRQSYQTIANHIGVSIRTVGRAVRYLSEHDLCGHAGKFISIDRRQYERIKDMI